jgi:hypothetical protein
MEILSSETPVQTKDRATAQRSDSGARVRRTSPHPACKIAPAGVGGTHIRLPQFSYKALRLR